MWYIQVEHGYNAILNAASSSVYSPGWTIGISTAEPSRV